MGGVKKLGDTLFNKLVWAKLRGIDVHWDGFIDKNYTEMLVARKDTRDPLFLSLKNNDTVDDITLGKILGFTCPMNLKNNNDNNLTLLIDGIYKGINYYIVAYKVDLNKCPFDTVRNIEKRRAKECQILFDSLNLPIFVKLSYEDNVA